MVFISHNLGSAVLADRIVVLNNGKIVEEGSHSALMKKKGYYYNLFKLQSENYKD